MSNSKVKRTRVSHQLNIPLPNLSKMCFEGLQDFHIFGYMLIGYKHFYFHFMQIPILEFGLDYYGSQPFNYIHWSYNVLIVDQKAILAVCQSAENKLTKERTFKLNFNRQQFYVPDIRYSSVVC